jgi:potassium efflux system protein
MTRIEVNPGRTSLVHVALILWLASLCLLTYPAAFAQTENMLSPDMVDARLAALRDAGTAEDAPVFTNYTDARELLVQAEALELERQQFVDALRSAPVQERLVQDRLEELETEAPPEVDVSSLDKDELNARLLTLRTEQDEAGNELATLERRLAARETNAAGIRERLAAIRLRIDEIPEEVPVASVEGSPSESEAIAWKTAAEHMALRAERQALEARLSSQTIRYSLITVQRAEQQLIVARLTPSIRALATELTERTLEVADARSLGFDPSAALYPIAQSLIEQDTALREERLSTNRHLTAAREAIEDISVRSAALNERYSIARRMVDFAADSDSLGQILLTHWQELQDEAAEEVGLDIPRQTAQTVIRRIELEEILKQLTSSSAKLDTLLAERGIDPARVDRSRYNALRELIRTYRKRLNATIDTQSVYVETLALLADNRNELARLTGEYSEYLTARILWIPNFRPLWETDFESLPQELTALTSDLGTVKIRPGLVSALYFLVAVFLLSRRKQLMLMQAELNQKLVKPRTDSIRHTLLVLVYGLLLSLPAPLLLAGLADSMKGGSLLGQEVGNLPLVLLLILFTRWICVPEGVGTVHFQWRQTVMNRLYQDTGWVMYYWLPMLSFVGWLMVVTPAASGGILARSILTAVLVPSIFLLTVKIIREAKATDERWFNDRLQRFRAFVAVGLTLVVIETLQGHVYSVNVLFNCILNTLMVGLALLLVYAVLIRWIRVARRKLRMAELLAAQSDSEAQEDVLMEEQAATLGDVSEDSRELVNAFVAAAGIAALLYIWSPLLPALDRLSDMTLWTSTTLVEGETIESRITLATILVILALAALTLYAARKLPAVIDLLLRSQTGVSASTRYTVSSLLNYSIIGVGTVAAFSAMGLQWSQMQWLVAALGVGIGFGLQEIIANFISGLIILFERPIRVGDVVSVGDKDGVVARVRIRATTVVDWDGKEVLIPNKEFITGRVVNWSLSDPKIRVVLPVGIAYGSDVEQALKILHEIVSSHPRVLEDPEPSIIFDGFGDNALSLVARCFLDSMENRVGVMTEMNREIYRRFGEAGIVIAFPQRDIHFDTDKPLRVAIESDNPDKP